MDGIGPPIPTPRLDRLIGLLAMVNAPLSRWGRNAAAVLIACMMALAVAQIVSRAAFSHTLDWAEELARFMLVWAVLLVTPFAYRSGAHVAIDSFAHALPPRLLLAASTLLNLLAGWICVRFLIESISFWQRGLSLTASALPVQMAWVYAIVPLALAVIVLVALELVLRLIGAQFRPDPKLRLSGAVPLVED
ncbi:MAG: TRAP transporter small permease [Xanthomonadales bacterium]|jgi:TRAP-type C4-dicarboxylate transport system permease small subunit|nr:TRAP transporter small permease [Xanthomonadales bacterium]